jgi:very-short-patch-repair endonuclease
VNQLKELKPRKALNKAYLKVKPNRTDIEGFKANLITLLDRTNETESEEFHKNLVSDFLKDTYYKQNHFINTKGRNDLVIHNGANANATVGVIIEAKKPTNKSEMVSTKKLNTKAFQELVLYYLRERITHKNLEVKHLVVTNINEWFIFDATLFDRLFAQNKNLVKQFHDFESGRLADTKTDFFYKQVAEPFIAEITAEIDFTYFNIQDYQKPLRNADKADDNSLIALFKLLSPEHLLKLPFTNDSNSLDKRFYSELLHIIGLTETKEGGKKLIERNKAGERNTGTILEDAIIQLDSLDKLSRLDKPSQYGSTQQERLFSVALELSITWINRILFLKLLEAQLITYHKGDRSYSFLNLDKIKNYDDLNSLFFQVLARRYDDRNEDVKQIFAKVPYLNSSLFEPTDLEQVTLFISNLKDEKSIPVISSTVLKDQQGKKRSGNLTTLEYLFEFLDAYDFGAEGGEEIQEDNKTLINASVLGLIFEKINGYKDGSFFTPGFITMYMCRETIRKAVVQKFNESLNSLSSTAEVNNTHSTGNSPKNPGIGKIELQGQKIDPIVLEFARSNRKKATQAEAFLWQILRNRKLNGLKFRRQHPVEDKYILDFYCAEKRLVVEIDGDYHLKADQKEYDEGRTSELNELELKVIRFTNDEVLFDTERVLQDILDASEISLTPQPPLPEREGEQVPSPFGKEDLGVMDSKQVPSPFGKEDLGVRDLKKQNQNVWNLETINDIYELIPLQISKKQANEIINSIKICDPAVGSGHFLVSALNEIIAVKNDLKILEDREGRSLHRYEVEVVNDELIVTDEEGELFEYNPSNKESQRIQETLFHEKQTIIENCLFGVDINSNSVKICRLRLWIELLKNAYYKNATELETLPNIDINIKCGNSLVSRFAIDADLKQALKKSKWSIDSYRIAVDTYRNAESKEQKREMERLIGDIKSDFRSEISINDPKLARLRKLSGELFQMTNQQQLFEMSKKEKAEWNKKVEFLTKETQKLETEIEEIKANKIFENAFEWRFEFPEVLNDEGDFVGFDVVIGNPPYGAEIEQREFYKTQYYEVSQGQIDTYKFFIKKGLDILKNEYWFTYITSDSYLEKEYFKDLRCFVTSKSQNISNIKLGDNVFPEVNLPTSIIELQKGINEKVFKYVDLSSDLRDELYTSLLNFNFNLSIPDFEVKFSINKSLIKEINTKPLIELYDQVMGVKVYQKGKGNPKQTNYEIDNNIFISNELIDKNYMPFISQGIKRYYYEEKNEFINYGPWLAEPRDLRFFQSKKIVLREIINPRIFGCLIEYPCVIKNISAVIIEKNTEFTLEFLLGLINSKLMTYHIFEQTPKSSNKSYPSFNSRLLKSIPIRIDNKLLIEQIAQLAIKIHQLKKENPTADTTELEAQIDQLVYQLYELTEEEIAIVEGSSK